MSTNVRAVFVGVLAAIIFLGVVKKYDAQKLCVAVLTDKNGIKHEINGTIKGEL